MGFFFPHQATTNYFELSNFYKNFIAAVAGFATTRFIAAFRGACLVWGGDDDMECMHPPAIPPSHYLCVC